MCFFRRWLPRGIPKLEGALKGLNNISPDGGWLDSIPKEAGLGVFYIKLRYGIFGQKIFGLDII